MHADGKGNMSTTIRMAVRVSISQQQQLTTKNNIRKYPATVAYGAKRWWGRRGLGLAQTRRKGEQPPDEVRKEQEEIEEIELMTQQKEETEGD
jgi:hypothetical protein